MNLPISIFKSFICCSFLQTQVRGCLGFFLFTLIEKSKSNNLRTGTGFHSYVGHLEQGCFDKQRILETGVFSLINEIYSKLKILGSLMRRNHNYCYRRLLLLNSQLFLSLTYHRHDLLDKCRITLTPWMKWVWISWFWRPELEFTLLEILQRR